MDTLSFPTTLPQLARKDFIGQSNFIKTKTLLTFVRESQENVVVNIKEYQPTVVPAPVSHMASAGYLHLNHKASQPLRSQSPSYATWCFLSPAADALL